MAATPDGGFIPPSAAPVQARWVYEWTRGETVVMDSETHGSPLDARVMVVGTSVSTISEAIARATTREVWVVGGAELIATVLDRAEMVVLTTQYGVRDGSLQSPRSLQSLQSPRSLQTPLQSPRPLQSRPMGDLRAYGFTCVWSSRLFRGPRGRFRYRVLTRQYTTCNNHSNHSNHATQSTHNNHNNHATQSTHAPHSTPHATHATHATQSTPHSTHAPHATQSTPHSKHSPHSPQSTQSTRPTRPTRSHPCVARA